MQIADIVQGHVMQLLSPSSQGPSALHAPTNDILLFPGVTLPLKFFLK